MESIYGEMDEGIKDLVTLLRSHDFDTFTSCQGGKGHAFQMPTVRIIPNSIDMNHDEEDLAMLLSAEGYGGYYIKRVHSYQNDSAPWEGGGENFLELEFWKWDYAAEHGVQLTAFGAWTRARLGSYIIRLGQWLASYGGN